MTRTYNAINGCGCGQLGGDCPGKRCPFHRDSVCAMTPPAPHAPECASGCSHVARDIAGPCQQQCVKTPEFVL